MKNIPIWPSTFVLGKDEEKQQFTMDASNGVWNVKAKLGSEIELIIPGNPTTGYQWFLENANEIDTSILEPLLNADNSFSEYKMDSNPKGMSGVGGNYFFRFTPKIAEGSVELKFVEMQPWDPEGAIRLTTFVKIVKISPQ
jgi:predicted secreted protein